MKIFYAIQATGNGHISRAMELLPHLKAIGEIDIFLSGNNSSLAMSESVTFRSKGLSLYYNCIGGLDYWKIMSNMNLHALKKEAGELPVENYDLVINDFEYITAMACKRKNIPSVNFGHQASFISSKVPRPEKKSRVGEYVLKNYARATSYLGLHFEPYDTFINTPIIKQDILQAVPYMGNHITVYLPSFCKKDLIGLFAPLKEFTFEIFIGQEKTDVFQNITFLPAKKELFNKSLICCKGIITGGGFETPAEAIHLGKKLLSIPIQNHYEQQCNAAALKRMGVKVLYSTKNFRKEVVKWIFEDEPIKRDYSGSMEQCINTLMQKKEVGVHNSLHMYSSSYDVY